MRRILAISFFLSGFLVTTDVAHAQEGSSKKHQAKTTPSSGLFNDNPPEEEPPTSEPVIPIADGTLLPDGKGPQVTFLVSRRRKDGGDERIPAPRVDAEQRACISKFKSRILESLKSATNLPPEKLGDIRIALIDFRSKIEPADQARQLTKERDPEYTVKLPYWPSTPAQEQWLDELSVRVRRAPKPGERHVVYSLPQDSMKMTDAEGPTKGQITMSYVAHLGHQGLCRAPSEKEGMGGQSASSSTGVDRAISSREAVGGSLQEKKTAHADEAACILSKYGDPGLDSVDIAETEQADNAEALKASREQDKALAPILKEN
jgi:hypothetical protein